MILRIIYKLWIYFWRTFFTLAGILLLVSTILVGLLQLPLSKEYINEEIQGLFNKQFEGELKIERISGFLPFYATLHSGEVYAPADTLSARLMFDEATIRIRWWDLLQRDLSISSFQVNEPYFSLDLQDNELVLATAFRRSENRDADPSSVSIEPAFLNQIRLYAPSIELSGGQIELDDTIELPDRLALNTPYTIQNLDLSIFLDISESQIFFDLSHLTADLPGTPYEFVRFSGQFYNDDEYFELNRFRTNTAIGNADFSFEASPVNIFKPSLNDQFREANYRVQITESSFTSGLIRQFVSAYPEFDERLELELDSKGTLDSYYIDKFQANIGESSILFSGELKHLLEESLEYDAHLDNVVIHPNTLEWISNTYLQERVNLERYQLSTARGTLNGDSNQLNSNIRIETEAGAFSLEGNLNFDDILHYDLVFNVDTLDVAPFLADTLNSSIIQGMLTLEGSGTGDLAAFQSTIDLSQSVLIGYEVNQFIANVGYSKPFWNFDIQGRDNEQLFVEAAGSYGMENGSTRLSSDGEVRNLNLKKFLPEYHADSTSLNSTFSGNLRWTNLDDLTGRISLEISESTINGEELRPHQFYADLNESIDDSRRLRLTSSFFDGELRGSVIPSQMRTVFDYWHDYFDERIEDEILFTDDMSDEAESEEPARTEQLTADLNIQLTVKDVSLLRMYFPELPDIESSVRLNSSINSTPQRLLITGSLFEEFFRYGNKEVENLNSAFTASFRSDRKFRESSTLDLQLNSSRSQIENHQFKESFFNLSVRDDSVRIQTDMERFDDDLKMQTTLTGHLKEGEFDLLLDDFILGNSEYQWISEGRPMLRYNSDRALRVDGLIMTSGTEHLEINGTYSSNPDDYVEYNVQNLDLSRLSDLIDGRIRFSGYMNGDFITRTLTEIPLFQGDMVIDQGRVMDRLIGDVTLNSSFNSETNLFDTNIHVLTDPEKYPQYHNRNDGIGQDIYFSGFFRLPDDDLDPDEDLFYFDADFREIDMWIVTFIVPNIIVDMEGSAAGTGYVRGTQNGIDFSSNFKVEDVHGVPFFTNVPYKLNGELDFTMDDGLLFRNIQLTDSRGGTGVLSGQVDLHRFTSQTDLDLTLDLNNLHFMNNTYDPDVPFYGTIYGTGQAQIAGSSTQPILRTTRPLIISPDSDISIPLEPVTEFEQDRRFIEFVDSFDTPFWYTSFSTMQLNENGNGGDEQLTFLQLFTMDLQFQANDPSNIRLIFDRVTNDVLSASGTGQVRVLLEDQNVSMFGRFNISDGDYQFVSGDIFTRRFTLQEGGSISWSGDIVDAALNVTAVYRARPNISTLLSGTGSSSLIDPNLRIPIELVLQIGGSMSAVENEFFFRVPSGIESSGDPTIASQINNLNQNEDQKLIQATSILISGNFLPMEQAQGLGLAETITGTTVVNPLLTSQLINPLLSNQINSLLRSDITFDIDLNLTTTNEVDLGVALRFFDDRIVLRREGQITGEQSDIGDLGATYRINRALSITAFHRQDPTLAYTSGIETRQSQEMNGIGMEAQIQFNTWQNLRARLSNAFRSLFGIKKDETPTDESIMIGG